MEDSDIIFIKIEQHLEKLWKENKRGPDFTEHGVLTSFCLSTIKETLISIVTT